MSRHLFNSIYIHFYTAILRTIFETKAEARILPLAFDLPEETETRILPLVI